MSQENVDLVRPLQPRPDTDLIELVTDDDKARRWRETNESLFDPGIQILFHYPGMAPVTFLDITGLRTAWKNWLTRWASYRVEIEDLVDAGDQVVVLHSDYARPEGGADEVVRRSGAVWTVRGGLVTRVEFFQRRAEALKAVGLTE
jgi:SnoaL-like domain